MHSLLLCQKLGVCGEAAPAGTALQSKPCSLPHHACPQAGAGTSWHGPLCHLTLTRAGAAGIFSWHLDALVVPVQPRLVIRGGMAAARWISHRLCLLHPSSMQRDAPMFMGTYGTVVTKCPGGPEPESQALSSQSREFQRRLQQRCGPRPQSV